MNFTNVVQLIAEDDSFHLRLREGVPIIERGLEPSFFIIDQDSHREYSGLYEGKSNEFFPITMLCHYLFPQYTDQELDTIVTGQDEEKLIQMDTAFRKVLALVHCHPDNVLEPSPQDLAVYNQFYESGMKREHAPIGIIGRGTQTFDLLFIRQKEELNMGRILEIPSDIEKYVIAAVIPRYLRQAAVADVEIEPITTTLKEMMSQPWDTYKENIKKYVSSLPYPEPLLAFRTQFKDNFTLFPEYPVAVLQAMRKTKLYDAALAKYDKGTMNIIECAGLEK